MYSLYSDIPEFLESIVYFIEDIIEQYGGGIIIAIAAVPICIFLLIAFASYIIKSYAVYKLGKKFNRDNAVFAWIPVFHDVFCMYVLSDMTEKPYFSIHPKIDSVLKIKNRKTAFYIYLGCALLLPVVVSVISGIIGFTLGWIPILGSMISALIGFVLGLIPAVTMAVFRFVYLRDILDALKRDKSDNQKMAIVICAVSYFVSLVFPIYLLTLLKYSPLDPSEYNDPYTYQGYGTPNGSPYGTPNRNPYGTPNGNPYAAPNGSPYGAPNGNPYGTPNGNPYGTPNGNPYGTPNGNPYAAPNGNPYGTPNGNPCDAPGTGSYTAPDPSADVSDTSDGNDIGASSVADSAAEASCASDNGTDSAAAEEPEQN